MSDKETGVQDCLRQVEDAMNACIHFQMSAESENQSEYAQVCEWFFKRLDQFRKGCMDYYGVPHGE